jgi:hypothetical protein
VPSAAPSLSAASILTGLLQSDLATIKSAIIYQDLYTSGVSTRVGGLDFCIPWTVGIGGRLNARTVFERPTNISLITYDANNDNRILRSCDNADKALLILKAVNSATTTAVATSCIGNGISRQWISKRCGDGVTAFCVDCIDPCGVNQCPSLNSLNPCGPNAYGCSSIDSSITAYRIMTATFKPLFVAPSIGAIVATPAKTSVSLSITLSDDGTVYCAYYVSGLVPSSLSAIQRQTFVARSTSSVATVNVFGLLPSSNYDIYCLVQSDLGTLSLIADALKTKTTITTVCCKTVNIIVSIQSLYVGSQSVNSISAVLDALPSSSLTLTMGTSINGFTSSLTPASIVVTNAVQISGASNTGIGASNTFSISGFSSNRIGVVGLVATLSGDSASEYSVVFVNGNSYTVIALSEPPQVPILSSVRFSADGTFLSAVFNADTNKASISASSFPCSQLFSFSGVAGATCSWSSPSLIAIELGSLASISVGGTVTLLGVSSSTFNITALCLNVIATEGTTACKDYQAILKTQRTVLMPFDAILPEVGISAPSGIGSCDRFTMDLSSSIGDGGRPFTGISFVVTTSNSTQPKLAQNFLNSFYIFSPPTAVPFGVFFTGVNNIAVTMCNFLGKCGSNSLQIVVLSTYVTSSLQLQ